MARIEVTFDEDTVWLLLEQMTDLFQRDKSTISRHIKNIFAEGELSPGSTVAKFATVQMEGTRQVSRDIEYYNLDVKCYNKVVTRTLHLLMDENCVIFGAMHFIFCAIKLRCRIPQGHDMSVFRFLCPHVVSIS